MRGENGYAQKLRRCKICNQWDVRMNTAAEYRLVRYGVEKNGQKVDCYAHPQCMESKYGRMWYVLLSDQSEYDRVEGRAPRQRKHAQSKRQKEAEESSRDFVDPDED